MSTTPSRTLRIPDKSSRSRVGFNAPSAIVGPEIALSSPLKRHSSSALIGSPSFSAGAGAGATGSGVDDDRLSTTDDAASTSSSTNTVCLKVNRTGTSASATPYFMSKTASKSSWFVLMRPSGIETIERSNRAARALISDVLPVPGGPCSNTPSFFGEPLTANLPVPAWNASRSDSNSSFSGKKSESNVFDAARR